MCISSKVLPRSENLPVTGSNRYLGNCRDILAESGLSGFIPHPLRNDLLNTAIGIPCVASPSSPYWSHSLVSGEKGLTMLGAMRGQVSHRARSSGGGWVVRVWAARHRVLLCALVDDEDWIRSPLTSDSTMDLQGICASALSWANTTNQSVH